MKIIQMYAKTVSRPECFVTGLTGVSQTLNVSLNVISGVGALRAAVVTRLAVMSPVSLLYQLLYLVTNLGHVSEGDNLPNITSSTVVSLDSFHLRIIGARWKTFFFLTFKVSVVFGLRVLS